MFLGLPSKEGLPLSLPFLISSGLVEQGVVESHVKQTSDPGSIVGHPPPKLRF